jgi:5-methyltetrahydrofolate--homocysteine methyltransferase
MEIVMADKDKIISLIRENVIQGRVNQDDEGLDDGLAGQPGVSELIDEALAEGLDIRDIINEGLSEGMKVVGQKFETGEFFIPDMLASAEAVGAAMEKLEPHLAQSGIEAKGKVLVATVKGDLHDIGKKPQDIVAAVREEKPQFLGLSALLTSTMANMGTTIEALKESGLRDTVKVVLGGAPVTEEFAQSIGADGYGADGFQAVELLESFTSRS